ncbi:MAG: hypothetical protein IT331_13350 [Anaerolineae bacterium]|nr:hypothetical protein [Anaerolineae bacterium]
MSHFIKIIVTVENQTCSRVYVTILDRKERTPFRSPRSTLRRAPPTLNQ